MKLEGTLQAVELTKGAKANTYDSIGNADVKFRRNTTDFFYLRNNQVELNSGITLYSNSAKLDTINTVGNNDLVLQRNGVEFMKFDSTDNKIHCPKELRIIGGTGKCRIFEADETTQNAFRIMNTEDTLPAIITFGVNANNNVVVIKDAGVDYSVPIKCNELNSIGDVDLVFKRNSVEYMKLDGANDVVNFSKGLTFNGFTIIKNPSETLKIEDTSNQRYIRFALGKHIDSFDGSNAHAGEFLYLNYYSQNTVVLGNDIVLVRASDVVFNQPIKSNTFNSSGDNDVVFQRNGVEYFKLDGANNIVNVATGRALSSDDIYANEYRPRSINTNTIWYGLGSGGTGYVEIFRHNYANSSLDFNCSIDNTGLSVVGNIIDTTISDERLKKNIEDVDANCLDCVKKVGIKSFEYKDEKYRDNDTFGFIAQQLLEYLPDELKNIVKENKEKDSDAKYLSINYMKLSVVLWGCNQQLIEKIEHLESSVYELQEAMKDI